jgi:hypothetical protein
VLAESPLASYDQVMGALDVRYSFKVLLLVHSADETQAWKDLEPYISPTGASSVKAAVDGTLGGSADWARVLEAAAISRVPYQGGLYWGVAFRVEVYDTV